MRYSSILGNWKSISINMMLEPYSVRLLHPIDKKVANL